MTHPIAAWCPSADDLENWRPSTAEERDVVKARHAELLAQWRQHPRWRAAGAAGHLVDDVHTMFRRAFRSIVRDLEMQKEQNKKGASVNVAAFQRALRSLEGHHRAEDTLFFPIVAERCPEVASALDFLSKDHAHLHPLERRVVQSGDVEALVEFTSFLDDHLNREEMLIVPLALAGKADI